MEKPTQYCKPITEIKRSDCEDLIKLALKEDLPQGDHTSETLFSMDEKGYAEVVSRETGIFCGRSVAEVLLEISNELFGGRVELVDCLADGEPFKNGDRVVALQGTLINLLKIERTLMNFLQYLSSISSNVGRAIAAADKEMVILDTRKTLPGFRKLAKYAVHVGGGINHRMNLSAMSMIKENHIAAAGGIKETINKIRAAHPGLTIEVEIETIGQLTEALSGRPDIIMLDNMTRQDIEECMKVIEAEPLDRRPFIEVSGGWTPESLTELHGIGKIGVSMGYLTHTTRFINFSMKLQKK